MGFVRITYTPRSGFGSSQNELDLADERALRRFSGFGDTDKETVVTRGGRAFSIVHDAFQRYTLRCERLGPKLNLGSHTDQFHRLTAWWAHAKAGGLFGLVLDTDEDEATTLSVAATQGDTTLNVASVSGFAAEEWLWIENANDSSVYERAQIDSVGGTLVIKTGGLEYDYPIGSTVRHAENFPSCLMLSGDLREREAGGGPDRWDLEMVFRTVEA